MLPVGAPWFTTESLGNGIELITEPFANPWVAGNIWHVRGSSRDLVVDAGLGVASLRRELPGLFANDPILVVTHAHLDHMGGAFEFVECWAHPAEAVESQSLQTLRGKELLATLGVPMGADDVAPPEFLIDAVPDETYAPGDYQLRPVHRPHLVQEGDVVDLGDRQLTVLHLPGHTPGSIALFEQDTSSLFSGDVIYDVGSARYLLDNLGNSDVESYLQTMDRLEQIGASTVYGGHGDPFDRDRLHELVTEYRALRT